MSFVSKREIQRDKNRHFNGNIQGTLKTQPHFNTKSFRLFDDTMLFDCRRFKDDQQVKKSDFNIKDINYLKVIHHEGLEKSKAFYLV